jgi:hypothetical protein
MYINSVIGYFLKSFLGALFKNIVTSFFIKDLFM